MATATSEPGATSQAAPARGAAAVAALPRSKQQPAILFTAFEPSGDDHAASVIAELKRRRPELRICAWGGEKMRAAGAEIVARTGDQAVMGMPGIGKLVEHHRINKQIAQWLGENRVALHVPVDSPAANFPICELTKARGIRVVHLVAPQVWAWGSWRVKKLRRLTDLVLCLLPFEEPWFAQRGVPATFVGHPKFDEPLDLDSLDEQGAGFPDVRAQEGEPQAPRLALLPGSRPAEIRSCWPILLDAYRRVQADFPKTSGVVALTRAQTEKQLREHADDAAGGWPDNLHVASASTDAAVRWCDYALVVSGTVTLQIARQHKPMVTVYRPNRLMYHALGRWIVATKVFTLPNLIAGRRIVPEFIPHFGNGEPLALEVIRFMRQPGYAEEQSQALGEVCAQFEGRTAGLASADAIERVLPAEALTPPLHPEAPTSTG